MLDRPCVAVIGAGIYGCKIALSLANAGYMVKLFERKHEIIDGASRNNQHRLHQGFHYPRDIETARQCKKGFHRFIEEFSPCISNKCPNLYCIASQGSLTSPEEYIKFCNEAQLNYEIVDTKLYPEIRGCALSVLCDEVIYDCGTLRQLLYDRLRDNALIELLCDTEITDIEEKIGNYCLKSNNGNYNSQFIINCSYSEINRLTQQLDRSVIPHQYEYTIMPIIELDLPRQGITIMDGQFMTLAPYGHSTNFLLYHVKHTVISTCISNTHPKSWNDPSTAPFANMDKELFFDNMKNACMEFVPALERAKLLGFLQTPRMVLANKDKTDARPSIITDHGNGYFTIFSSKIDHCIWIADEVIDRIEKQL
jgi:glycine/D-amino acid oxidase-like deaminating enzyme